MGTENTGLCKAGMETCTNGTWGPCDGEVVPTPEKCVLGSGDEDCNGSACSEPLWVRTYPNANTSGVAFHPTGDVYLGGFFTGSAWGLTSKGAKRDGFVARLDGTSGDQLWSVAIGDTGADSVLKVRAHGNTVTAIGLTDGGTLGGVTLSQGVFVAQFSDTGQLNWIKGCAGGKLGDLAIDPLTGDAVAVGYYTSLNCGSGVLTASSPADVYRVRFAAADGAAMLTTWSPTGNNFVESGAADLLGTSIIAGNTPTAWTWNGKSLAAGAFIAKVNPSGSLAWTVSPGDGLVFQLDSGDSTVVGANCNGAFDFGAGALPPPIGSTDLCIASLSSAGSQQWAKRLGSGAVMSANGIASDDETSETFVLGHAASGSTPIDTFVASQTDFLVALDMGGEAAWVDSMSFDVGGTIAANAKYVAVAGSFENPANLFGAKQPATVGVSDSFVAIVQR